MTRVDFYILETKQKHEIDRFVCRLIQKACKQNHRIGITAESESSAQMLDKLLWTFDDISFIPHAYLTPETPTPLPSVLITTKTELPAGYDMLINLAIQIPLNYAQFTRIIEVVSQMEEHKHQSRARYRAYQQQSCELTTHQISTEKIR